MALRDVLQFPDPRLKRMSEPIEKITDEIRALAQDMLEVMYDEPGIGLAAPQVGEAVRLIVMDTDWKAEEGDGERNPLVLVNPEIVEREGTLIWTEGCLSVPDFRPRWSARRACACAAAISTAASTKRRPTSCAPSASSTRSTISTACCSSTASAG